MIPAGELAWSRVDKPEDFVKLNEQVQVKITKIDSETKKSIAGVALRVTAKDQTSPALKQDDSPLVGTDGFQGAIVVFWETGKTERPSRAIRPHELPVSRPADPTRLFDEAPRPCEKNVQGSRPA